MSARFADHFSKAADGYAAYRPSYPPELFAFCAEEAPGRRMAWDCGAGSGQATFALAEHFDRVLATDASRDQVMRAKSGERVLFAAAQAEHAPLADGSCDLVTVAQALHWFDRPAFYRELERVLVPGGLFACWSYNFCHAEPEIEPLLLRLRAAIEDDWPAGREHVNASYRTIDMPFPELSVPTLVMREEWSLESFLGYFRTWSGVRRHHARTGVHPVDALAIDLRAAWGERATRPIEWPLALRAARLV